MILDQKFYIEYFPVTTKPHAGGLPETVDAASVEHVVVDGYVLHALHLMVALFQMMSSTK